VTHQKRVAPQFQTNDEIMLGLDPTDIVVFVDLYVPNTSSSYPKKSFVLHMTILRRILKSCLIGTQTIPQSNVLQNIACLNKYSSTCIYFHGNVCMFVYACIRYTTVSYLTSVHAMSFTYVSS
jgi:hypothetical protein